MMIYQSIPWQNGKQSILVPAVSFASPLVTNMVETPATIRIRSTAKHQLQLSTFSSPSPLLYYARHALTALSSHDKEERMAWMSEIFSTLGSILRTRRAHNSLSFSSPGGR